MAARSALPDGLGWATKYVDGQYRASDEVSQAGFTGFVLRRFARASFEKTVNVAHKARRVFVGVPAGSLTGRTSISRQWTSSYAVFAIGSCCGARAFKAVAPATE